MSHNPRVLQVREIQCFLVVAEVLHFTRAARQLGMSQQPLSRLIARLEERLGVTLFDRTTRSVSLTPAGEVLRREGARALAQVTLTERAVRVAGRPEVRVVYPGTLGPLPHAALAEFERQHPEVVVRASLRRSFEQAHLVRSGQADLGFLMPPIPEDALASRRLVSVEMGLALPKGHALANGRHPLAHFRNDRWILYAPRRKRPLMDAIRTWCSVAGFTVRGSVEAEDEVDAVALVEQGLGVAFVSLSVRHGRGVVVRRLREAPRVELFAVWRIDDVRPELAALVDVLSRASAGHPRRIDRRPSPEKRPPPR